MRTGLKYGFGLIAIYLIAAYATNFGALATPAATGSATVIKAFQGRN